MTKRHRNPAPKYDGGSLIYMCFGKNIAFSLCYMRWSQRVRLSGPQHQRRARVTAHLYRGTLPRIQFRENPLQLVSAEVSRLHMPVC